MCVLVISSHGVMDENNAYQILFHDHEWVSLFDLIDPVQAYMVNRPFLIFIQTCDRDCDGHCRYATVPIANPRSDKMRDTFLFYASTDGNVALFPHAPTDKPSDDCEDCVNGCCNYHTPPSHFLAILAEKLTEFGQTEELNSIAALVVQEMANRCASDPTSRALPRIDQSLTRLVRFRQPSVLGTQIEPNIKMCVTLGSRMQPRLTDTDQKLIQAHFNERRPFTVKWETMGPTQTNCDDRQDTLTTYFRPGVFILDEGATKEPGLYNYSEEIKCGHRPGSKLGINAAIHLSCYLPIQNESPKHISFRIFGEYYKDRALGHRAILPKIEFKLSVHHDGKTTKRVIEDERNAVVIKKFDIEKEVTFECKINFVK